jgi:hypothetical protein
LRKLLLLFFILPLNLFSQDYYFFPSDKTFNPVSAGIFESRIGAIKFSGKDELRLDIGASPDILGYQTISGNKYSAGVDFFTFSSLRTEKNFKFPVDAIDYFFGINLNGKNQINENFILSGRFRISHISAHFQDGHIYENSEKAITFSREFSELNLQSENYFTGGFILKNQLGVKYIFHSIPDDISSFAAQYGFEMKYVISEILSLYFSDEIRVTGIRQKTYYNNNIETGLTIGGLRSRAVHLFFTYYDGRDYRGQYYDRYLNYKGIGFNINL